MGFDLTPNNKAKYRNAIKQSNVGRSTGRNQALQLLTNNHINEIFSQLAQNDSIDNEEEFKDTITSIKGNAISKRRERIDKLDKAIQKRRASAAEAERAVETMYYRGELQSREVPNIQPTIIDNTENNCFILGHGATIKNQYIMIPNDIHLKFYVSKGEPLLSNRYESALSQYFSNPNALLGEKSHLLSSDSITHNMSIGLLTIFKKSYNAIKRKNIYGNTREYNGINFFEHSGIFVGGYIKPFKNITAEEYRNMGIELLNINENIKILNFGDNIYGIIQ